MFCRELGLNLPAPDLSDWLAMLERLATREKTVRIALVGKYVALHDAYLSVAEALRHAGYDLGTQVEIVWTDSETVTLENAAERFSGCSGVIVPGGFGTRGIEGKIAAAHWARKNNVPFLGLCLGMQIAVIELARYACGWTDANSREFDPYTAHNVIDFMPGQSEEQAKGGTMRLGSYPCRIKEHTCLAKAYGKELIQERHRHRYEFNNDYRTMLEQCGMVVSGTSPDQQIVECIEYSGNRFHVGVQFHPEFKSRPNRPHPLFRAFIQAALETYCS